jgi:hypothetical protein
MALSPCSSRSWKWHPQRQYVEIQVLKYYRSPIQVEGGIESSANRPEVILAGRQSSPELTSAFIRPHLLEQNTAQFLAGNGLDFDAKTNKVLVIGRAINKNCIIFIFCIGLVVAIVVGTVVGVRSNRPEIGLASGTGVVGVIATMEAMLFWSLK